MVVSWTKSTPESEHSRSEESAAYFDAVGLVPRYGDTAAGQLRQTRDATLKALAQLGPLRLQCDRSYVSLIDGLTQYIIAEVTLSTSYYGNGDGPSLGVVARDINQAVSSPLIAAFMGDAQLSETETPNCFANNSQYFIRDLLDSPDFGDQSHVEGRSRMRSYLGVPLKTSKGFVIGAYCVTDTRTRDDWRHEAVPVLEEIAWTISNHLELRKIQKHHKRSERWAESLSAYMNGKTSVRRSSNEAIPLASPRSVLPTVQPPADRTDPIPQSETVDAPILPSPVNSPSLVDVVQPLNNGSVVAGLDNNEVPPEASKQDFDSPTDEAASSLRATGPDTEKLNDTLFSTKDIETAFSRAANLILEATALDGIVFFDACPAGFSSRLIRGEGSAGRRPRDTQTLPSALHREDSDLICDALVFTGGSQELLGSRSYDISADTLQRLCQRYPQGHRSCIEELSAAISRLPEQRTTEPSKNHPPEQEDISSLIPMFPSARSMVFVPMWDHQKEAWCSAAVGWTSQPGAINSDDLSYLSAFSNSVMVEISQIETISASKAKSDFISSISHELRSPLHGILASLELLRDTSLDSESASLADMIEICGTTLLDTMDHLLDYSKINRLIEASRHDTDKAYPANQDKYKFKKRLEKTIDLSILVQDAVEGVYLGHSARSDLLPGVAIHEDSSVFNPSMRAQSAGIDHVLVTEGIEKIDNWRIRADPGLWKRIILNLFGNALKYTTRGTIKTGIGAVSQSDSMLSVGNDSDVAFYVRFWVKDTGRGIGREYLKHRLFTPYAQENTLASGTGLGLCIVNQLVTQLGGTINIQSEVNVGTHVDVLVPINRGQLDVEPATELPYQSTIETISKSKIRVITDSACRQDEHDIPVPPGDNLIDSFVQVSKAWFNVNIAESEPSENIEGDFCILDTTSLSEEQILGILEKIRKVPLIVLCPVPPTSAQKEAASRSNAVQLLQPFGPRKILSTFDKAQEIGKRMAARIAEGADDDLNPETKTERQPPTAASDAAGKSTTVLPERADASPSSLALVDTPTAEKGAAVLPLRSPSNENQSAGKTRPLHLLLVEDNEINLRILTALARKLHCTYVTAVNGLKAVEAFKAAKGWFDVILMDLSMPVLSGLEATREIRAYETEVLDKSYQDTDEMSKVTKIFAVTGVGSGESQEDALASGMDKYLIKPVSLKMLREVLFDDDSKLSVTQSDTR